MKFEQLFIQAINKMDSYITMFSSLEEQPEVILTDIFSGESDNLLTRVFESSNELTGEMLEVHDLQDALYQILIPYLSTLSILKGKRLIYDSEKYPAPIQIFDDNREIGWINIFKQEFIMLPHEQMLRDEQDLNKLYQEMSENAEEVARYEEYQRDPMSYGDNTMQKMKIAMNKKKYVEEIKTKYIELAEYSLDIERSIISQKLQLERTMEAVRPYLDMQYQIASYFRDKYKYTIQE